MWVTAIINSPIAAVSDTIADATLRRAWRCGSTPSVGQPGPSLHSWWLRPLHPCTWGPAVLFAAAAGVHLRARRVGTYCSLPKQAGVCLLGDLQQAAYRLPGPNDRLVEQSVSQQLATPLPWGGGPLHWWSPTTTLPRAPESQPSSTVARPDTGSMYSPGPGWK